MITIKWSQKLEQIIQWLVQFQNSTSKYKFENFVVDGKNKFWVFEQHSGPGGRLGPVHTWNNRRLLLSRLRVRCDRVLSDELFPAYLPLFETNGNIEWHLTRTLASPGQLSGDSILSHLRAIRCVLHTRDVIHSLWTIS